MLLTTTLLVLVPALLLRALRNGWYMCHLFLALGGAYWLEQRYTFPAFHNVTLFYASIVHLLSITLSTFLLYGWDKRAAQRGNWRVPERTLHAFSLVGGTLGAVAGSKLFYHNTLKRTFRQQFWLVVLLQVAIIAGG